MGGKRVEVMVVTMARFGKQAQSLFPNEGSEGTLKRSRETSIISFLRRQLLEPLPCWSLGLSALRALPSSHPSSSVLQRLV